VFNAAPPGVAPVWVVTPLLNLHFTKCTRRTDVARRDATRARLAFLVGARIDGFADGVKGERGGGNNALSRLVDHVAS